jgi:hypothetical protein
MPARHRSLRGATCQIPRAQPPYDEARGYILGMHATITPGEELPACDTKIKKVINNQLGKKRKKISGADFWVTVLKIFSEPIFLYFYIYKNRQIAFLFIIGPTSGHAWY